VRGKDYFDVAPDEKLFDTPAAIARVSRSTRDLLQKSFGELQIQVVETCHQVQSQTESLPSVSIFFSQDSEHFQFPDHVLAHDSSTRESPILAFLLRVQLAPSWFLLGRLAIAVEFL
jgi:hypothetical protein